MRLRNHLLFLLLLIHSSAFALRCGNELIAVGDSSLRVLKLCGKPAKKISVPTRKKNKHARKKSRQKIWIYNRGPNDFLYEVNFENDKVSAIHSKGYGF